jgi:PLP dependent protein
MISSISEQITQIQATLPDSVRLIAVSKQVSVAAIREAYAAGVRDFGESRVQEAAAKQAELQDLQDITWHFIGRLQANKAKKALQQFQWIHSVDSLKLALRLNELASELAVSPQVCLQVKILSDPSKTGWTIPQLKTDLPQLDQYKNLQIQGLMTIPPQNLSPADGLNVFERTQKLLREIQEMHLSHIQMQELSMGMSGDYQLAVQAGSTMVRLGTILFGSRQLPDSDITE